MNQAPPPQQHKIMRQVLEVRGCAPEATQHIQVLLRDTYYQRLLPLIETICSDLSASNRIHRIDRLEIELGELPVDGFDAPLAESFEAAFREKLAAAISDAPEIDADLALFDYFIRTGSVPWWANPGSSTQLEASLGRLIQRAPHTLRRALQTAPELTQVRRRIVRAYPDHLLDDLVCVLAPSVSTIGSSVTTHAVNGVGTAWLVLVEAGSHTQSTARLATRHLFWEEVLHVASTAEHTPASAATHFYQTILTRVAQRLGRDYRALITDLHRVLEVDDLPIPTWVREITAELWKALGSESSPAHPVTKPKEPDSPLDTVRADLMDILAQLDRPSAPNIALWTQLRAVIERLPAHLKNQALAAFDAANGRNVHQQRNNLTKNETTSVNQESSALIHDTRAPANLDHSVHAPHLTKTTRPSTKDALIALAQTTFDQLSSSSIDTVHVDLMDILVQLERPSAPNIALLTQLRAVIERLPAHLKDQALAAFDTASSSANAHQQRNDLTKNETTSESQEDSARLNDTRAPANLDHAEHASHPTKTTQSSTKDALIALARTTLNQLPSATIRQQDVPITSSFSEADALYVGNAGLVILWPFLGHFFERLGLTHDKQFKDEAAIQRAVGLLQYLASADETPSEILLPLNKILCGMAPETVFDFGPAISVQEKEECDDLLAAVIQQAPILHAMSSAGFRGSFLLRQGQLSTRDGQWLLRVERETHDIVLDRFPWGVSIVRLPWMVAMMQVEW